MNKHLPLAFTLIPALLFGKIIETEFFSEVAEYLVPNTLVLCDLDNTLIEASQSLGFVSWGDSHRAKLAASGFSKEEAAKIVDDLWMQILPIMPMRLVDK